MRRFVRFRLCERLPDETTILNVCHLLQQHNLGKGLNREINEHLKVLELGLSRGTTVDATTIDAPSSTSGDRDPRIHQVKRGNEWHFRMKPHIGVDAAGRVVHSMPAIGANQQDIKKMHRLLHGGGEQCGGYSS